MRWATLLILLAAVAGGCSNEPQTPTAWPSSTRPKITNGAIPISEVTREQIEDADLSILFIGNSHSAPMPECIARLALKGQPRRKVVCSSAEGYGFLVDHVKMKATLEAMQRGPWDYIVLQAQKYSQSGRFEYGYDGAIELTKLADENGSTVIMYPEWGQRGNKEEGRRVHSIHEEIAGITGAKVAPVGLAWGAALEERPELVLHAPDGNHAAALGNHLTASVIYARMTEQNPNEPVGGDPSVEAFLDKIAWGTVRTHLASLQSAGNTGAEDEATAPSNR